MLRQFLLPVKRGLYVAITGHGFGHGVRVSSVLKELLNIDADLPITINTSLSPHTLSRFLNIPLCDDPSLDHRALPGNIRVHNRALDIGILQKDSLNMDQSATLKELNGLIRGFRDLLEQEVELIQKRNIGVLLSDIPPLASLLGQEASISTLAMGNFGWDFIYRNLGEDYRLFAEWSSILYGNTDLLFRLPFHEPMESFPYSLDVGLPVLHPVSSPEAIRRELALPETGCIFVTFGGMGLNSIPWENVQMFDGKRFPSRTFITYDSTAPDFPNVRKVNHHIAPDLLSVCDMVFTKPGFSILADAYLSEKPIFAIERNDFPETPILYDAMKNYFHSRIVTHDECFGSDWSFLLEDPDAPESSSALTTDGARVIADRIFQMLS